MVFDRNTNVLFFPNNIVFHCMCRKQHHIKSCRKEDGGALQSRTLNYSAS